MLAEALTLILAISGLVGAATASAQSSSASGDGSRVQVRHFDHPPLSDLLPDARSGFSPTITFDEYPTDTSADGAYADLGIRFSGTQLVDDTGAPDSPVLSGIPTFTGPIVALFVLPGYRYPTTAESLSMDVGYIDEPNTVELKVFSKSGTDSYPLSDTGYYTVDASESSQITGFLLSNDGGDEPAGFGLDNLRFSPALSCGRDSQGLLAAVLGGLRCKLAPAALGARCGFNLGSSLFGPLKAFKAYRNAKGLFVLKKIDKKYRGIAKVYNDIFGATVLKGAPKGYRTTRELIEKADRAKTGAEFVKLLPNFAKAISKDDLKLLLRDVADLAGFDACFDALADLA